MRLRNMTAIVMTGILLALCGGAAWAAGQQGQVITPETREWAKKVLLDEQRLGASAATNTLMVLYYRNNSGNAALDPLQKGLTLMLITDLSQVKELQIVERIKLQALLDELGMGASGVVAPETAPRAGKLLGARWVVGGDLAALPAERLEVTSRLIDVPTTRIVGQPTGTGVLEEFLRMEKEIVFDIVKLLRISLTPEMEATMGKPFSTSVKAVTALSVAVDASDHGDYIRAADLYEEALREDPAIPIAAAALQELRDLGLLDGWRRVHGLPPLKAKKSEEPSSSADSTTKSSDILSTVSNATSLIRMQAMPIIFSSIGPLDPKGVSSPIPSPLMKSIISSSPVTGSMIFPSPNVSASPR